MHRYGHTYSSRQLGGVCCTAAAVRRKIFDFFCAISSSSLSLFTAFFRYNTSTAVYDEKDVVKKRSRR